MAEVLPLRQDDEFGAAPNLLDIPPMLERLAARIRAGECGNVARCSVVVRATDREPAVIAFGEADSCRTFEDLHLGAARLLQMLEH